jgi:uncharacterized membrane protein
MVSQLEQQNYIDEKKKEFAMNIDEFMIGDTIIDSDGSNCKICNKTVNSIEVSIKRKNDKGCNSEQWFDMKQFNKRFKILN